MEETRDGDGTPLHTDTKDNKSNQERLTVLKASLGDTDSKDAAGSKISEKPLRPDTPGPMPDHMYNHDELMQLAETCGAKIRPKCLSPEFDSAEGFWDPEKWFRSFGGIGGGSRGNSPLTTADRRKRPPEIDREVLLKRRPSDPRERLREDSGIVLSPQRRSFGTGCHVTQTQTSNNPPCQIILDRSNRDRDRDSHDDRMRDRDRERGRGDSSQARRIGSGRIQLDRDHERDRHDYRNGRDRFDSPRDDRRFERFRRDSEGYDQRDHHYDNRKYNHRYGNQHREEEPEWFSSGPTSQHDTIELHGFEKFSDEERMEDQGEEEVDTQHETDKKEEIRLQDRNGSLETNESSSPEASHHKERVSEEEKPGQSDFDFDQFFKLSNIPGLSDQPNTMEGSGSRFSRWFPQKAGGANSGSNSRTNSRRSSVTDEFGFIADLIGQKSPSNSSPTHFDPSQLSPLNGTPIEEKKHGLHILDILHGAHKAQAANSQVDSSAPNAAAVEADLKAILLGGKPAPIEPPHSVTGTPAIPKGKVMTAAELEADLKQMVLTAPGQQGSSPTAPQTSILPGVHQAPHGLHHSAQRPPQIQNAIPGVPQQPMTPLGPPQENKLPETPSDSKNMDAFNKLLGLMRANGSLVETPQMPASRSDGTRGVSPTQLAALQREAQQKQIIQDILRNPQAQQNIQQLQQQTLQQQQMQVQLQQQLQHQQQQHTQRDMTLQQKVAQAKQQHEAIMNFLRNNPSLCGSNPTIVTKPASPVPPGMPGTPGQPMQQTLPTAVSPQAIQQALLQQQQSTPVKAPSPIMFGSQPPMHLRAPSPIHPTPLGAQGQAGGLQPSGSPSSPVMPRVPSPQDLIAHTQAIMQNALIKKQLEDQKERFLKKQHESPGNMRVKSPNSGMGMQMPATPMQILGMVPPGTPKTPQTKPAVSAAFTPTSVIRKMANEKAEEKEKAAKEAASTDGSGTGTPIQKSDSQESTTEVQSGPLSPTSQTETNKTPRPLVGKGNMNQPNIPHTPAQAQQIHHLQQIQQMQQGTPAGQPGRAIVKGPGPLSPQSPGRQANNVPQTPVMSKSNEQQQRPIMGSQGNIDINKLLEQQKLQQQQFVHQQTPQQLSPNSAVARGLPGSPYGAIPIAGRPGPMQRGGLSPVPNQANQQAAMANQLLVQRMLQQQGGLSPRAIQQLNQLNQINQLVALQQAQQRMGIDPRLQQQMSPNPRPGFSNSIPLNAAANPAVINAAMNAAVSRALSPQPPQPPIPTPMIPNQMHPEMMNGPLSPGRPIQGSQGGVPGMAGAEGMNLQKWFGNIQSQQLPSMPPLPQQGQKVLTVDEIERRQQMVTH